MKDILRINMKQTQKWGASRWTDFTVLALRHHFIDMSQFRSRSFKILTLHSHENKAKQLSLILYLYDIFPLSKTSMLILYLMATSQGFLNIFFGPVLLNFSYYLENNAPRQLISFNFPQITIFSHVQEL